MVKLSFRVTVQADFAKVWGYFRQFDKITEWDPNTRKCEVQKKTPGEVGSVYNLVTVFNGNESTVVYTTRNFSQRADEASLSLFGENDMITAEDQIICRRKGTSTEVEYNADICLRGIKVLFTPFIIPSLNRITDQAQQGMITKARELWGHAQ